MAFPNQVPSLQLFCVFSIHRTRSEGFSVGAVHLLPLKIQSTISSICPSCLGLVPIEQNYNHDSNDDDLTFPVLNFRSRRLTKTAVSLGHETCFRFLIENGFWCDLKECLVSAAHFGHVLIFKTLFDIMTAGGKTIDPDTTYQVIFGSVLQSRFDIFQIWIRIPSFAGRFTEFEKRILWEKQWE